MLVLLGSAQHPMYAHPKLLAQCYDNVYHQGCLIGNLLAQGKQPTVAQMKKIYDQEYEELVAQIKNTLDLLLQSMAYPIVPTSLLNPDIVLPPKTFQEQQELPEAPLGHMPLPWDFTFDGARGLIDLSWEQQVPMVQQDDIDKNPLHNQYLYQEVDDFDDEEEDIEIDDRMPVQLLQLAPDVHTIVHQLAMPPTLNSIWVLPRVSIQTRKQLWNLAP